MMKDLVDQEKTQQLIQSLESDDKENELQQLLEEIVKVEEEVKEAKRYNVNQQS